MSSIRGAQSTRLKFFPIFFFSTSDLRFFLDFVSSLTSRRMLEELIRVYDIGRTPRG